MSDKEILCVPPAPKFDTALNIPTVAKLETCSSKAMEEAEGRAYQVMPTSTTCVIGDLNSAHDMSIRRHMTKYARHTCRT